MSRFQLTWTVSGSKNILKYKNCQDLTGRTNEMIETLELWEHVPNSRVAFEFGPIILRANKIEYRKNPSIMT